MSEFDTYFPMDEDDFDEVEMDRASVLNEIARIQALPKPLHFKDKDRLDMLNRIVEGWKGKDDSQGISQPAS